MTEINSQYFWADLQKKKKNMKTYAHDIIKTNT